jgi:hypothetical protein
MPLVREVVDADLEGVGSLYSIAGWPAPTRETWAHFWAKNPALTDAPAACRGWVLDHEGQLVGYLANILQSYRLGERTITAACAANMVVQPEFRGSSMQLYLAFVRQRGVDLLLNTTAAPHVSQISEFLKFKRLPQPDYNRVIFWVLRPFEFAPAALRKKGLPGIVSVLGGPALGASLALESLSRLRSRPASSSGIELRVVEIENVGEEFNQLWRRVSSAESGSLLALRDAATLRWHFANRSPQHDSCFLAAFRGGSLEGYAAVIRQDNPQLGLTRAKLADLVVANGDRDITRWLISGAFRLARRRGAAMIEVVGFPQRVRAILDEFSPRRREDAPWPFLYKALDPALDPILAKEATWMACLYDGDGSL